LPAALYRATLESATGSGRRSSMAQADGVPPDSGSATASPSPSEAVLSKSSPAGCVGVCCVSTYRSVTSAWLRTRL
jgi:hypothetical protein